MECFTLEVFPNFPSAKDSLNSYNSFMSFLFSSPDRLVPSRLNVGVAVDIVTLSKDFPSPTIIMFCLGIKDAIFMPLYNIMGIGPVFITYNFTPFPSLTVLRLLATSMFLGLPSTSPSSMSPSPIQPLPSSPFIFPSNNSIECPGICTSSDTTTTLSLHGGVTLSVLEPMMGISTKS